MFSLEDLTVWARTVLAVLALFSLGGPALGTRKVLSRLSLPHPAWFYVLGQLSALVGFLVPLFHRHSLHNYPPFWASLIIGLLVLIALAALVIYGNVERSRFQYAVSLLLFVVFVASIIIGVTMFVSLLTIFPWQIEGSVHSPKGDPLSTCTVYALSFSDEVITKTETNPQGRFILLLTLREAERVGAVAACKPSKDGANWATGWTAGELGDPTQLQLDLVVDPGGN